jgi:hypothetical protein
MTIVACLTIRIPNLLNRFVHDLVDLLDDMVGVKVAEKGLLVTFYGFNTRAVEHGAATISRLETYDSSPVTMRRSSQFDCQV